MYIEELVEHVTESRKFLLLNHLSHFMHWMDAVLLLLFALLVRSVFAFHVKTRNFIRAWTTQVTLALLLATAEIMLQKRDCASSTKVIIQYLLLPIMQRIFIGPLIIMIRAVTKIMRFIAKAPLAFFRYFSEKLKAYAWSLMLNGFVPPKPIFVRIGQLIIKLIPTISTIIFTVVAIEARQEYIASGMTDKLFTEACYRIIQYYVKAAALCAGIMLLPVLLNLVLCAGFAIIVLCLALLVGGIGVILFVPYVVILLLVLGFVVVMSALLCSLFTPFVNFQGNYPLTNVICGVL